VVLEQLQDGQHDVVDVAEATRLHSTAQVFVAADKTYVQQQQTP
jgi:hypothetical protein